MIIDKTTRGGFLSSSEPVLDHDPYPSFINPLSASQQFRVYKSDDLKDSIPCEAKSPNDTNSVDSCFEYSNCSSLMVPNPSDVDDAEDCKCGWWSFRPKFLHKFSTPKWVLAFLCLASCLQGLIVNGFVNVVITSIERRFEIRSTDSGIIAGSYDFGTLICLIPVTYIGGHASKPLLIGLGIMIAGLGSFIFSMPHFTTESYSYSVDVENLCYVRNGTTCAISNATNLSSYKYMFFFGQLLHGIGYSPLYTLGVTYIDESVSTKMSSVYLGIFYLMSVIGPALGYVLGGQMLKLYTDFYHFDTSLLGLPISSNLWVGAWWLGFIIASGLALFVGIPLTLFPKELPGTAKIRMNKVSETHQKTENSAAAQNGFGIALKDLPASSKILMSNPTFIFTSFAGAVEAFLLASLSTFLPKYIEAQFNLMPSWAAFLMGLITVLGAGSGMIIGGYLIKKMKLQCQGILKFCCIGAFISLCLMFVFAIRCESSPFAGVSTPYQNIGSGKCNSKCNCQSSDYDPICGADGINYYSSCFAGCQQMHKVSSAKVFSNCSCISDVGKPEMIDNKQIYVQAQRSKCATDCNLLPVFLLIVFFCMFFTFVIVTPSLQVTLRCVAESQRSFALGVQWIFIRILGSIPGPIVVGALIDQSCNLWQELCDGSFGACRSYDNYILSITMGIVALVTKLSSVVMFLLALYSYKPPNNNSSTKTNADTHASPPNSVTLTTICSKVEKQAKENVNGVAFKAVPVD